MILLATVLCTTLVITDGDTFVCNDERIRILGLDAPETYWAECGVPRNYVQAHMWLNLPASRSPASDAKGRDLAIKTRDIVASKMTPEQIAEAQKLAREWKPK